MISNNLVYGILPEIHDQEAMTTIGSGINSDTTPSEFDELCLNHPNCKKQLHIALLQSILKENIPMIEHLVQISDSSLLLNIVSGWPVLAPLGVACRFLKGEKSFLIAKTLLKLGSPVNVVAPDFLKKITPLQIALESKEYRTAALLMRHGGFLCPENDNDLKAANAGMEEAEKKIMYPSEMLFKMHFNEFDIPKEIINMILSLNVELELRDSPISLCLFPQTCPKIRKDKCHLDDMF